ncbi:TetR/AcrR family transcriptional regulator [Pseudonocardiaceae bacterium YIM PH 21723]|nr:TetR/AcrR family transcriptional regulator [Pseudonocardiaceae bacterium YIM PH 21723]
MSGRTWGGTTLADRKAVRRQQLLIAALELVGEAGMAGVSVRAVCRTAKLTERYFYESFADREELLVAVFDQVSAEAAVALFEAADIGGGTEAVAKAAVAAFVELIVDDPARRIVLLAAPLSEPALARRQTELLPRFISVVQGQAPGSMSAQEREMGALAVLGALQSLFLAYVDGRLTVGRDALVSYCVRMLISAYRVGSRMGITD